MSEVLPFPQVQAQAAAEPALGQGFDEPLEIRISRGDHDIVWISSAGQDVICPLDPIDRELALAMIYIALGMLTVGSKDLSSWPR